MTPVVVPRLYPTPVDLQEAITRITTTTTRTPAEGGSTTTTTTRTPYVAPRNPLDIPGGSHAASPTLPLWPEGGPSQGEVVADIAIAAAVGAGLAVTGAAGLPWVGAIRAMAGRVLGGGYTAGVPRLATQAGVIAPSVPAKKALVAGGGMAIVRAIVSRTPDMIQEDVVKATIEELVVSHMLPTAGERAVAYSRARASVSEPSPEPEPEAGPTPRAATGAGAGGYFYDFSSYLNSQLGVEGPKPSDAAGDLRVY